MPMKTIPVAMLMFLFTSVRMHGQSLCAEVISAEKAFAALSLEKNIQEAFLANMCEQSVMSGKNGFENGLANYRKQPKDTAAALTWEPDFAAISAAGDLGYTTGPFQYSLGGKDVVYGNFATVWQKQPDGQWKLLIDLGNSVSAGKDPREKTAGACIMPELLPKHAQNDTDLVALDHNFSTKIWAGLMAVYKDVAHPEMHILWPGKTTIVTDAARKDFYNQQVSIRFHPERQFLAHSRDFGVVYGKCEVSADNKEGVYMHVWRRDPSKGWQLLHETVKY